MNEQPLSRRDRIARVRLRVAAGTTAVFLATLAGVVAVGRQPAARVATASASSTPAATTTQTYQDDSGSTSSDYSSGDSSSATAPSSTPTPMTTRSS